MNVSDFLFRTWRPRRTELGRRGARRRRERAAGTPARTRRRRNPSRARISRETEAVRSGNGGSHGRYSDFTFNTIFLCSRDSSSSSSSSSDSSSESSSDSSSDSSRSRSRGREKKSGRKAGKDKRKESKTKEAPTEKEKPRERSKSGGRKKSSSPPPTKIHIGRLTRNVNKDHLTEIFSTFGKIKDIEFGSERLRPWLNKGD